MSVSIANNVKQYLLIEINERILFKIIEIRKCYIDCRPFVWVK